MEIKIDISLAKPIVPGGGTVIIIYDAVGDGDESELLQRSVTVSDPFSIVRFRYKKSSNWKIQFSLASPDGLQRSTQTKVLSIGNGAFSGDAEIINYEVFYVLGNSVTETMSRTEATKFPDEIKVSQLTCVGLKALKSAPGHANRFEEAIALMGRRNLRYSFPYLLTLSNLMVLTIS